MSFMPGSMADGGHRGKAWMRSHEIERIDIVKTVTGVSGDSVMFSVPTMAVMGKKHEVATITFPTPLMGRYNLTNDVGYMSVKGVKSADIAIRPFNNATLNVAGASAVMSMKDIKVLLKKGDLFIFEYSKLGVYLPDGTAKVYKLEKPVKVTYMKDRHILVVDSYSSLTKAMMSDMTSAATFPANAAPVYIKDIISAEMSGDMTRVCYTPPTASAMPAPTVAPTVTPTPTAVPTASPTAVPTVSPTVVPTATPAP